MPTSPSPKPAPITTTREINLAIEKGEVAGGCGQSWSSVAAIYQSAFNEGRIKALVHLSGSPDRPVGMSIGIAVWDQQADEALDAFLARADAAMYQAKRSGKGHYNIADPPVPVPDKTAEQKA